MEKEQVVNHTDQDTLSEALPGVIEGHHSSIEVSTKQGFKEQERISKYQLGTSKQNKNKKCKGRTGWSSTAFFHPLRRVLGHLTSFKGTVSRDNLYSIFFIYHILLVLQEVLYEDFNAWAKLLPIFFNVKIFFLILFLFKLKNNRRLTLVFINHLTIKLKQKA
jgi:hypothetical protein